VDAWAAVSAAGTFAAAGVAAWAAFQARSAARESNAAAATMAHIERERRRSELTPWFRVSCETCGPGSAGRRLRVMLIGPPGLERLDALLVTIRDDQFQRGDGPQLAGGPTREEIKEHVWGPYRFRPGTGPGEARADPTGRTTECGLLPAGEDLPFYLDATAPPLWAAGMSQATWQHEVGTVVRIALTGQHSAYGSWTLHGEIDAAAGDRTAIYLPPRPPGSGVSG
jgi:hypothetical protein